MSRLRFRNFAGGLWLPGPREELPEGTVRRGRGLHKTQTSSARSRSGSTLLFPLDAHSLSRFVISRFQGVGTDFYRDGALIRSSLSGNRLTFLRMPPTVGKDDYLYVAGGSNPGFKVDSAGAVTNWGIAAPLSKPACTLLPQELQVIDTFNGEAGDFNLVPGSDAGSSVSNEGTITIGGGSLQVNVPKNVSVAWERIFPGSIDLSMFAGGIVSPDEDYIQFWIHLRNPARIEQITLSFLVGDTTGNDLYIREILVEDTVSKKALKQERGLGDLVPISNQDDAFMLTEKTKPEQLSLQEQLGTVKLIATRHTWTRLRLPKSTFNRSGTNGATWSDIRGIRIGIRTNQNGPANSTTNVYFDECDLIGSVGMQGDYQYLFTFKDDVTGVRSNPNTILSPAIVFGAVRQGVHVSGIPFPAEPNVTTVEAWRTLGNGAIFFKAWEVPVGTLTFNDTVADYLGLYGNTASVLSDELLPLDNIFPANALSFQGAFITGATVAVGPHYGRVFWVHDGGAGAGRLYYSPPGRPEGVEGFIDVTTTDDPTEMAVRWNDSLYVFTQDGLYEIVGTTTPFIPRRVLGAPGTIYPYSVVAAPDGIYYRAPDGPRRFDGATSQLVGFPAVAPIFRGENVAGYAPFGGLVAAFADDEVHFSDGFQTLSWHVREGRWRDLGSLGIHALLYEDDTGLTIASFGGNVVILEDPAAMTDAGAAILFDLETPAAMLHAGRQPLVQYLYVEANTQGQLLTPTLILENSEILLPPLVTTTQKVVEYPILLNMRTCGIRLTGHLTAPVEVFGVEMDVYAAGTIPSEEAPAAMQAASQAESAK
jgi:hypothetical protein